MPEDADVQPFKEFLAKIVAFICLNSTGWPDAIALF